MKLRVTRVFPAFLRGILSPADIAIKPGPAVQVLPTPEQGELQRLRLRVNELTREVEELRRGQPDPVTAAKRFDIALIKQADKSQAQGIKFRRLKGEVVRMKTLYGHIAPYLRSLPKAGFSQLQKAAIDDIAYAAEQIGAIDPDLFGLSRAEEVRVIEQKNLARAVLAGLDVVNQLSADHNPQTSNNGALTHDDSNSRQAENQAQGQNASASPYSSHPQEDDGEAG
jgi:hypothetical protein